jgi:hypothetical protein
VPSVINRMPGGRDFSDLDLFIDVFSQRGNAPVCVSRSTARRRVDHRGLRERTGSGARD